MWEDKRALKEAAPQLVAHETDQIEGATIRRYIKRATEEDLAIDCEKTLLSLQQAQGGMKRELYVMMPTKRMVR